MLAWTAPILAQGNPGAAALPSSPRWSIALPAPAVAAPAASGPVVAVPLHGGGIAAYRLADGSPAWTAPLAPTQPIASGEQQFFVVVANTIHALDAGTGAVAWKAELTPIAEMPVTRSGWVIVSSDSGLTALRSSDGRQMWHAEIGRVNGRVAIDGEHVFASVPDRRLVALNITTGERAWERTLGGAPGEPYAIGGVVYAGAEDRYFYALDAATGEIEWRHRTGAAARGRAVADEEHVYFVGMDNVVYAFDRRHGALRWRKGVTYRPAGGPAMVKGLLVVPGPVTTLSALAAAGGADAGSIPFGATLATLPEFVAQPDGTVLVAAVTGGLASTWQLSVRGPELVPRLALTPLTELPGVPIPLAPPGR